jgi:hypothetical protein
MLSTELELETTIAAAEPAKFTIEQAKAYLAGLTGKRPSVRALEIQWGWSRSTVARFLSQHDGTPSGTAPGQAPCPTPATPMEPDAEQYDWTTANTDIVVHHEPALAIYCNPYGQVVIRRDCQEDCENDHFVFFSPNRAAAVIAGIQRVLRDIEEDAK